MLHPITSYPIWKRFAANTLLLMQLERPPSYFSFVDFCMLFEADYHSHVVDAFFGCSSSCCKVHGVRRHYNDQQSKYH